MLVLLGVAEALGMSLWFAGNAVAPQLQERWQLTAGQVGWLTTSVQLGFVAGTAAIAVLNLADLLASRLLFTVAVLAGAVVNAALLLVDGFGAALATRFLCGFCLAGVYPPGMKMIATWFKARRGLAVGTIVAGVTIGKALPWLLQTLPHPGLDAVILAGSGTAVIAAAMVWFGYRDGPYPFAPRPFSWALVGTVVSQRQWRLATGGYLGHMFELYSYWTWIPAFLAASAAASGGASRTFIYMLAFGTIAIGGVGSVWGGWVADRIGRERFVIIAMAVSGACALLIGLTFGGSWWVLAPLALVWGCFVVADSAQFSVLVTESVPSHAVGTALMLQTSLGFLLTTVTIQLVPPVVEFAGWRWAFPLLALGPIAGIAAINRLFSLNRQKGPENSRAPEPLPSITT
ncbi:MAG TPA: MFS transporter [Chloroflexota bacterium]|nr:MFS transporter [Chloroflexota bacterium]